MPGKIRLFGILAIVVLFSSVLALRLYSLTGPEKETWEERANDLSIKTIYTPGSRGEIYDRNGVLLAGNRASFSITFDQGKMDSEETNEALLNTVDILDKNGEKIIVELPVKKKNGEWYWVYDKEIRDYLKEEKLPKNISAAEAFARIRKRFGISESVDNYAAQKTLIEKYDYAPPISVIGMSWSEQIKKNTFLELYEIPNDATAEEAFAKLRKHYKIDADISEKKASKIIAIRYAISSQGYYRYLPVVIAKKVSKETVAIIEEESHIANGCSVIIDSSRYYPEGRTASHLLGYMGYIPESEKNTYAEKGYLTSDMIGLEGAEVALEKTLKGTYGVRKIQINSGGEKVRDIGEETEPVKGKDIFLTIDSRLQNIAEDALETEIKALQAGKAVADRNAYNAEVAAVVAINTKTGEPLAVASYPDYDPNIFANGISNKEWDDLQPDNPRDVLAPRPLYNVALKTPVQPGSAFKPLVAIAALNHGLSPYTSINDAGFVKIGNTQHDCLIWSRYHATHGDVNLAEALEVSCNYYFYSVAKGVNWNDRSSLGYTMNVDDITEVAKDYGLGVKSGIELDETISPSPNSKQKIEETENILKNYLLSESEFIFKSDVRASEEKLIDTVDKIASWTKENPPLETLQERLEKLGVAKEKSSELASEIKATYYDYAKWTDSDILNISIGQGENAYTTLQMANYTATIANDGVRYKASIVKAVEGKGEVKREVAKNTKTDKDKIAAVKEGMRRVVANGSLSGLLTGLAESVSAKTGTAENMSYKNPKSEVAYIKEHLGSINPKLSFKKVKKEMKRLMKKYPNIYSSEDTAVRAAVKNLSGEGFDMEKLNAYKSQYDPYTWIIAFAPSGDPEIAVASLVFQGNASAAPAPIVRKVINGYLTLKAEDEAAGKGKIDYNKFLEEKRKQ